MICVRCELGLSSGKDGGGRSSVQACAFWTEVEIRGAGDVEDVHEQVEMMAFAGQCDVFDQSQIKVEKSRLPKPISPRNETINDRPVVEVVGVVLHVEADQWRERQARAS